MAKTKRKLTRLKPPTFARLSDPEIRAFAQRAGMQPRVVAALANSSRALPLSINPKRRLQHLMAITVGYTRDELLREDGIGASSLMQISNWLDRGGLGLSDE